MKKQHLFLLTISLMLSTFSFSQVIHNEAFKLSNSFGDFQMRRYISGDLTYRRALVPSYNATTKTASLLINYAGDFTDGVRVMGTKTVFDGNVGIGTTNPSEKLHVNGNIKTSGVIMSNGSNKNIEWNTSSWGSGFGHKIYSYDPGGKTLLNIAARHDNSNWTDLMTFTSNGKVGIGTNTPKSKLEVNGDISLSRSHKIKFLEYVGGGDRAFIRSTNGVNGNYNSLIFAIGGGTESMIIHANGGNVGIGTLEPGSWKLAVNGKIRAKEIKVETGWSDFVFENEYNLPSLKEVEKHIKEKGHLKDIPSASEVANNGIFLGDMNAKLLQKIEELTLYTIQQQKELEAQQQKNKNLEARLTALEAHLKN